MSAMVVVGARYDWCCDGDDAGVVFLAKWEARRTGKGGKEKRTEEERGKMMNRRVRTISLLEDMGIE